MKLAFTTLGCPEWDLSTIAARAMEYGYDGVDFRGYRGRIPLPELPEFTTRAAESAALLHGAGLAIPALSSSACVAGDRQAALGEIAAYARICRSFGAPLLRVFAGGDFVEADRSHAAVNAILTLREAADIVAPYDVTIVLETHDKWVAGASLRPIMEAVDSPRVGVLWDVHHPYRLAGESPAATWEAIGPWVKYTHVKDSRLDPAHPDGYQLCLTGAGDLPLPEIIRVLQAGGYDGWLTLEWEKKWHPELEAPEVAFPGYVKYMRGLL
jgi:sugar phosphate isomerase/epimerase